MKLLKLITIGLIISQVSCSEEEETLTFSKPSLKNATKISSINNNITSSSTIESLQSTLKILFNTNVGGNNFMSTTSSIEANNIGVTGQTYYVSKNYIENETQPLYRAYNGSKHITTTSISGEGNYTVEGGLGYMWNLNQAPNGTSPIYRVYNHNNGDHSLANDNYIIPNYNSKEYFNTYGYPRYNKKEELLSLNGNSIIVKSNLVAGGSVWELWWNGKQFIDVHDYGRQIQASLNLGNDALPTEAGDQWHDNNFHFMHGSPLLEAKNIGKTQITKAIPLEWNNTIFNSTGNKHDLVIYKDFQLGKEIRLDETLNLGNFSYLSNQIIKYKTTFYTPIELKGVHIEIPTGYLKSEFNRFFEVDATNSNLNNALNEVSLSIGESIQAPNYEAGGIIISNQSLDYAMGVYINSTKSKLNDNDPHSIYYFRNWKFGNTSKWSAGRYGTIPSGNNEFNSYIIVGTLDQVRLAMRVLYTNSY